MVKKIQMHSIALMGFGLLTLVVFTVVLVAGHSTFRHSLMEANYRAVIEASNLKVMNFQVKTSQELDQTFRLERYDWPPSTQQAVPPLILAELPDDFAKIRDHKKRQNLFLRTLLPIVMIENRRIREQRELAKMLLQSEQLTEGSPMHRWLLKLAKELRVHGDLKKPKVIARLLNRLDEIPPALALAQSAIETGWGTSRFALEGNSLFGQWTFKRSHGLEPSNRDLDASHYVASFSTLRDSVRAYMRNLNIGHAYDEFRQARARLRADGVSLQSEELAVYLHRYSQRGKKYVADLQRMIKSRHIAFLTNTSRGPMESKLVVADLGTNL